MLAVEIVISIKIYYTLEINEILPKASKITDLQNEMLAGIATKYFGVY